MDDTACRLTLRSDLFDPSNETRKPFGHGSPSVHAYADTVTWYITTQRPGVLVGNESAGNTFSWEVKGIRTNIVALSSHW